MKNVVIIFILAPLRFKKNYKNLFHFFLFYLLYEPVFYKFSAMGNFSHIRREANFYANPIIPNTITKKANQNTLEKYIKSYCSPCQKENALHFKNFNLNKFQYGSSFELRIFNGTLNKTVWQNYINMVLSSLTFCLSENFNSQKIKKQLKTEIKKRTDWLLIEEQVKYVDQLLEEFVKQVFPYQIDQDLFYEQYSGTYLKTKGTS